MNRIREIRESQGITQADLATKAGITQGMVSDYERGKITNPTLAVSKKIALALGVTLDELFPEPGCVTHRT